MRRVFRNGRYANVTATLALVVALGGTGYAAIKLPANSVGSKQLKPRAVTGSDIRINAVTSAKVKNGSLRAADFKAGQLPAGSPGPPGPPGMAKLVRRRLGSQPVAPDAVGAVTIACKPGEQALSAGLDGGIFPSPEANSFTIVNSFPVTTATLVGDTPTSWYVAARNTTNAPNQFLTFVVCVVP